MPKPSTIHLHIDNLVLRGFDNINGDAVSAALQEALTQELCSAPALCNANLSSARASVTLPAHYNAQTLGSALAQSLTEVAFPDRAKPYGSHHG